MYDSKVCAPSKHLHGRRNDFLVFAALNQEVDNDGSLQVCLDLVELEENYQ
jgi:hypothetical protein